MKLVHCSYHKCVTVYYSMVLSKLYNRLFFLSRGYKHFNSLIDDFYRESDNYKIASVNNHAIDLQKLGKEFRISRFVRDPRDLIVSGYFYHKRGAEAWCNIVDPTDSDWKVVNGYIPESMGEGHSYASCLQELSEEEGLIAEIDFRTHHFSSMMQWPKDDPRIRVYKYEDMLGNEREVFKDIFKFYELTWLEAEFVSLLADHFSVKKQKGSVQHIRNAKSSQWKEHFTPRVEDYFEQKYGGLLERYGYS